MLSGPGGSSTPAGSSGTSLGSSIISNTRSAAASPALIVLLDLLSFLNGLYTRIMVVKKPANEPSVRVPAESDEVAYHTTATTANAPIASISGPVKALIRATRM